MSCCPCGICTLALNLLYLTLFLGLTCYIALQDTSLNMLFAGHDTSASAIMLAMRHLKLQPCLLHKLRQEQQQVCYTTSPLPLWSEPIAQCALRFLSNV